MADRRSLFCDWWRLQRELDAVFGAIYAAGRAVREGLDVRAAVLEVLP